MQRGEAGPVGVVVDVAGDGRQRGAEYWWCLGLVLGGEQDEEPVADLGVEDGDADAVGGEHIVSIMRMSHFELRDYRRELERAIAFFDRQTSVPPPRARLQARLDDVVAEQDDRKRLADA
jgi:hypothetical protein